MQQDTDNRSTMEIPYRLTGEFSLILKKVRLLQDCRLNWLEHLLTENAVLAETDEPELEIQWRQNSFTHVYQEIQQLNKDISGHERSQFKKLALLFDLSEDEQEVLQICVAHALDPTLQAQLPAIKNQSGNQALTEYAIARLLGFGRGFCLANDCALFSWGLINTDSEEQGLCLDTQIKSWLLGRHDIHVSLKPFAGFIPSKGPLTEWPVLDTARLLETVIEDKISRSIIINVYGQRGQGKKTFAACVCERLGLPLLALDAEHLSFSRWQDIYLCAQRQAFLDGCALGWCNTKMPLPVISGGVFPIQFIFDAKRGDTEDVITTSDALIINIDLPELSVQSKQKLFDEFLAQQVSDNEELDELMQLKLSIADIVHVGHTLNKESSKLKQRINIRQKKLLSGLAEPLTTPFTRNDWIVNDYLLRVFDDFIYEGYERDALWQQDELQRLFPRGKGLVALLSGPSGTGKTMAAQVAAFELNREIYRVDLSRVVSKYIGETAENLANVIKRAEDLNVVLLFDEADALFSKRTEVKDSHDRYANMDINYLLQAVENYSGIAFLATNKKSNMDSSFIRRLRYVLEFPIPENEQRKQLWQRLLDSMIVEGVEYDREAVCERLASQIKLTGSQIKYSILSALFIARRQQMRVNVEHLLEGIQRELLKEGRSLSEHEIKAVLNGLYILSVSGN